MSNKIIGRIVGALFLLAFVFYLPGGLLVESAIGTAGGLSGVAANETQLAIGALLMLANSAAVAGIGILMVPVLRPRHEITAYAYVVTRMVEAIVLAVGVVFLLLLIPLAREQADVGPANASILPALAQVAKEGNHYAYLIGMTALGLGSLLLCRALLRAGLVPRFMAVWGLVGYGIFLTGMILEIVGHPVAVALSGPGGLFEIGLGVLLVVKGFPAGQRPHRDRPAHHTAPLGPPDG